MGAQSGTYSEVQLPAIRVLLVDDHDVLRGGIVTVLEFFDDLQLVGEANNGQQAVELCARLQPDVVLMDLVMPVMDGITASAIIREKFPQIRIVALTSYEDTNLIDAARDLGFNGYLLKNISMDDLANAIRSAHQGKIGTFPDGS